MSNKSWLADALKHPEKHPFIYLFVITFAFAVAGNGLSNLILDNLCAWLEQQTTILKLIWQLVVVGSLGSFFAVNLTNISALWPSRLTRSIPAQAKVRELPASQTAKGLIVFMSLSVESPAKIAILHHWDNGNGNLNHCWLICGGDDSLAKATELVNLLVGIKLPARMFHFGTSYTYPNPDDRTQELSLVSNLNLANDPSHIRQIIEAIYDSAEAEPYSIAENEMIIDYTGGTKSMTAGAILAGASPERRLQYIVSDYDDKNKPINSRVMEVDISYQVKPNKNN